MSKRTTISKSKQATIFTRDKWCCRYCGVEVFFSPALKALNSRFPNSGYYHRNGRKDKMSQLLLNRCGAIDHIVPVSKGGSNDLDNLICACWQCNSTKSNSESIDWINKILKIDELVTADGWDGLLSVLLGLNPESEWQKHFVVRPIDSNL